MLDRVKNGDINFIINTPSGKIPREDEVTIRNASLAQKIPIMTTVRAAQASANGIRSLQKAILRVKTLAGISRRQGADQKPRDERRCDLVLTGSCVER